NWKTLAKEEFAVPPIDEQRRLLPVLRATEDARAAGETLGSQMFTLLRSACVDLGHRVERENLWPMALFGDLGEVRMGRQRSPKYQTGKFTKPYLRVANVFDGYIDTSDVLEMDFDKSDYATYRLREGDILLNEGQSRELVGRSAIYRGEVPDCCFQNTI